MNIILAQKLLEKGVIRFETEIEARYHAIDLSGHSASRVTGHFIVRAVRRSKVDGSLWFEVASTVNGSRRRIAVSDIVAIDGMDPARLASIYNIREDGTDKAAGKRRGRKPKSVLAAEAAARQEAEAELEGEFEDEDETDEEDEFEGELECEGV